MDGGPGAGQAALVSRSPHPVRQQPAGHDAGPAARGIPDEAFTAIEGDAKAVCSAAKQRNREARRKGGFLFDAALQPWRGLGDFATGVLSLEAIGDETIEDVRRRQELYEELVHSSGYRDGRHLADA